MPSLSRWLNSLNIRESDSSIPTENVPAQTVTSYFLAPSVPPDPTSSSPILYAVPPPNRSQKQPPGSLHFGLTHPSSASSSYGTSTFLLSCVPDPIGYLVHSASFIRSHLGSGSSGPSKWRHSDLHLILEDEDGLAYTSAGKIHISLRWVGDLERQVKDGARDMQSAAKEIKGVLLHELVHAVQYDGHGSTPIWLIESIADYVRLQADLGPPHWRHPGQGKAEKGWEVGYDAGAQFLSWLVGATGVEADDQASHAGDTSSPLPRPTPTATGAASAVPPPQATQYPAEMRPPSPGPEPKKGRKRPGPWPGFVKSLNARLEHERYTERCWADLTGQQGGLEELWAAYLGHYA